jgi:restriction system protein
MMQNAYQDLMRPLYDKYSEAEDTVGEVVAQPPSIDPVRIVSSLHQQATSTLQKNLLAHVYAQDHHFFEGLIIDVLLAMGYGGRRRDLTRRLGRSHDGGIDGVIKQDELGLDLIMLQAKRLKPGATVSAGQVRDFAGGLEGAKATKGIFFTTAQFSGQAQNFAQSISRRIVLINGHDLTALMVRHNIGVRVSESFVFKSLENSFFSAPS